MVGDAEKLSWPQLLEPLQLSWCQCEPGGLPAYHAAVNHIQVILVCYPYGLETVTKWLTSCPATAHPPAMVYLDHHFQREHALATLQQGGVEYLDVQMPKRFIVQRLSMILAVRKHAQAIQPEAEAPRLEPARTRLRTLVVEDGGVAAAVLQSFLQQEGHKVTMAYTGSQAMASIQHHFFDWIFLDIHLPDMSGLELYKRLRQRLTFGVGITATTGDLDEYNTEDYLKMGFDGLLRKPVNPEALRACLSQGCRLESSALPEHSVVMEMTPKLLVDGQRARRIIQFYDRATRKRLAHIFDEEMVSQFQALGEAVQKLDRPSLGFICHRMVSSAASFACHRLTVLAKQMGQEGGWKAQKELEADLLNLEHAYHATRQALTHVFDLEGEL
ncbi:response regulator receiver protein [Magnetococcus marinus MC-1]|uniref:Response regulator receiver protein n=1 Tax=Magnetococcus marinus (strain ATCC BAA-1437 / JCM 17883 / MC-1) TaxID=156889 RepID=A0LB46_MAGMM|nr:response regulator receiver protein [Magnetococcus marinus MC-1]